MNKCVTCKNKKDKGTINFKCLACKWAYFEGYKAFCEKEDLYEAKNDLDSKTEWLERN